MKAIRIIGFLVNTMRMKWRGLVFLVTFGVIAVPSQATYNEIKGDYVYTVTPWMDFYTNKDLVRGFMKKSVDIVSFQVKALISEGVIPETILSVDDIDQLIEAEDRIDKVIQHLNNWISEKELDGDSGDRYGWWRPKAIVTSLGLSISGNFKVGASGALQLGSVFMPVKVQKTNLLTGEVSPPEMRLKWSPIWMSTGGLGGGVGGGARGNFALMFVFGGPEFDRPEEFHGWGLGFSGSVSLGMGIEVKKGFMGFNDDIPGFIDFGYVSFSGGVGASAGGHLHGNVMGVFPMGIIKELADHTSVEGELSRLEMERSIQRAVDEKVEELLRTLSQP